jgi:hypothetical protein
MTWLAHIVAMTDAGTVFNGVLALITSGMWIRIEHRLTQIETNCKRCNEHAPHR